MFGGSFDPFHNGHLGIIDLLGNEFSQLERVFLIPTAVNPFKSEVLFSDQVRLDTLGIITKSYNKCEISDFELNKGGKSWTIDSICYFEKKYPDKNWGLVIGSDQYFKFHLWKEYQEILKKVSLIVINRGEVVDQRKYDEYQSTVLIKGLATVIFLTMDPVMVSSTEIREKLKKGEDIKALVPQDIYSYLLDHRFMEAKE